MTEENIGTVELVSTSNGNDPEQISAQKRTLDSGVADINETNSKKVKTEDDEQEPENKEVRDDGQESENQMEVTTEEVKMEMKEKEPENKVEDKVDGQESENKEVKDDGQGLENKVEVEETTEKVKTEVKENNSEFEATESKVEAKEMNSSTDSAAPTSQRHPKRKVAMLLSYSGTNYHGMQVNPGVQTVEAELLKALKLSNAISEANSISLQKCDYQRCARTDKGVSARGNVISMKIQVPNGTTEKDAMKNINEHLPEDINVMGIQKVPKSFNSKNSCSSRLYDYVIPTFAFAKTLEESTIDYRIDSETLERVRKILKMYLGTHKFHNYTLKKLFHEDSSNRFIMKFITTEPFVIDGMELLRMTVQGQSFMIHQIRKMIGMVVALVRNLVEYDIFQKSFDDCKFDVPKAPGLGLMLNTVYFEKHDRKYGATHGRLVWTEEQDAIEEFANRVILARVVRVEKEENSMIEWLTTLHNDHKFFENCKGLSDFGIPDHGTVRQMTAEDDTTNTKTK